MSLVSSLKFASVSPSMCLTISGDVVMDLAFLLMPGQYQTLSLLASSVFALATELSKTRPPEPIPLLARPHRSEPWPSARNTGVYRSRHNASGSWEVGFIFNRQDAGLSGCILFLPMLGDGRANFY